MNLWAQNTDMLMNNNDFTNLISVQKSCFDDISYEGHEFSQAYDKQSHFLNASENTRKESTEVSVTPVSVNDDCNRASTSVPNQHEIFKQKDSKSKCDLH